MRGKMRVNTITGSHRPGGTAVRKHPANTEKKKERDNGVVNAPCLQNQLAGSNPGVWSETA